MGQSLVGFICLLSHDRLKETIRLGHLKHKKRHANYNRGLMSNTNLSTVLICLAYRFLEIQIDFVGATTSHVPPRKAL